MNLLCRQKMLFLAYQRTTVIEFFVSHFTIDSEKSENCKSCI